MDFYQQNNTSVRFTSIQIVNVTFNQIVIDSNINSLLSKLKVSFSELERLMKLKMPSNDVKRKAIEVSSTFEVLMKSTKELDFNSRDEFSKKIIESCVAVIEKYKEAESDEEFGAELRQELISGCIDFFEQELGSQLNDNFWFELQYYEWLEKEGFIKQHYYRFNQKSNRYHSDENLEKFFSDNRGSIIRRMLGEQREHGNSLAISSPLSDQRKKTAFQAFIQLPS